MTPEYSLEWKRVTIPHPEYGSAFAWEAMSIAMTPTLYHVIRTPHNKYDVWLMPPDTGWRDMGKKGDMMPVWVTHRVTSAGMAKEMCEGIDRLLLQVLRNERKPSVLTGLFSPPKM